MLKFEQLLTWEGRWAFATGHTIDSYSSIT